MLPPRCGYSGYLSSLVATDSTVVNIPVQSILHTFAKISGWSLGSQDIWILNINWASQEVLVVKNLASNAGDTRDAGSTSGSGRSPGEGSGNPPTPVFLPGEFHGQRSLRGYSPWGCKESDTTERQSNMINWHWSAKSHGRRILVSCSPRGRWESDTTEGLFTITHWRGKWQPTPVFLPGESWGQGSLVGCRLWGRTESGTTEMT